MTKMFVITPVAITALCWTAWCRIMLTILYTSQLKALSVLLVAELQGCLTQRRTVRIPNECLRRVVKLKPLLA